MNAAPKPNAQGPSLLLPILGLVAGVSAMIPPYLDVFGKLDVAARLEFADHVVPGIAVLAAAIVGYLVVRRGEGSELPLFVGGGVIALAGFWMMATHLPLVKLARNGQDPWDLVLWHSLPGLAVTLLGVAWTIRFWGSDAPAKAQSGG